ncbi:putative NAD-dependent epimerase/dehydratase [Dictyobacter alpinus]|uniref:Putative NAD-dependent epimerase/dehydratase n=1 Tax=Dictyobacter alpinus TaxID=2014873 RepID=A0A402BBZ4_9CHLR|nr:SDR family oxidoreductase [Dictyobacter alpinus]GCE28854.1 putative NAD-dependent epimerase/dehydratase [Dictyobacter alpinus]
MRVFVTGATGYIGSVLVRELLDAGHQVVGLSRSDTGAAALKAAGAEVQHGTLDDLKSLRSGAAAADGVIHLAYVHDFSDMAAAAAIDRRAIETIGAVLEGSGKPFVGTSGTLMLTPGRVGTEEEEGAAGLPRAVAENTVIAMAGRDVRSAVVRLAPTVHGEGDIHGFIPSLIGLARAKGVSAYIADGANRWPAVHRLDAAQLFRLALEDAPAGTRLHGAAEEGVPFRAIAEAIGRQLKLPVVSIDPKDAADHFGWLSMMVPIDNPISNALTRERMGWQPTRPALIEDIEHGHYFNLKK